MRRLWPTTLICLLLCGAKASGDTLPVWRHAAVNPIGDSGLVFMAAKGDFGAAFGLDLQMVSMRGDPLLLKSLVAGELDSYTGGPASPMIAAAKGAPIRIVGCNWVKQTYTFWGRNSVGGLADVQGKIVGIPSPGSSLDIFIRTALLNVGVAAKTVTFVVTGTPADSLRSLSAGVIDAAATPDEYGGRATKIGLHPLATTLQVTPLALQRCYYVSTETMRLHKDVVARFLAAEMAGQSYALSPSRRGDRPVAVSDAGPAGCRGAGGVVRQHRGQPRAGSIVRCAAGEFGMDAKRAGDGWAFDRGLRSCLDRRRVGFAGGAGTVGSGWRPGRGERCRGTQGAWGSLENNKRRPRAGRRVTVEGSGSFLKKRAKKLLFVGVCPIVSRAL